LCNNGHGGVLPCILHLLRAVGAKAQQGILYLGLANCPGSLLIAIFAPFIGAIADYGIYKNRLLAFFASLGAILY